MPKCGSPTCPEPDRDHSIGDLHEWDGPGYLCELCSPYGRVAERARQKAPRGFTPPGLVTCGQCGGRGYYRRVDRWGESWRRVCWVCKGTGKAPRVYMLAGSPPAAPQPMGGHGRCPGCGGFATPSGACKDCGDT
jgi:hypothetical protein